MTTRRKLDTVLGDLGELLERRVSGRGLDAYAPYKGRIVAFAREVLDFDPWEPHQREMLEAVLEHPQTLAMGGNAVGKDAAAAVASLYWTFVERGRVLVTAAVERQLVDVFMGEVGRLWRASGLPGELYRSALRVPGEDHAGIITFTSTESSRLTGYHAPRTLAILTEAQAVESFAWEGLMANAVAEEDRILAVGNPLSPEGNFYRFSRSGDWHTIRIPVTAHPNLREDTDREIPGGPSPAFLRRAERTWGAESDQYAARIDARFPETSEDALNDPERIDDAVRRHAESDPPDVYWTLGVDPARHGPDETVVAMRRGRRVEGFETWRQQDTQESARRVCRLVRKLHDGGRSPVRAVYIDDIGLGAGVVDRAKEELDTTWMESRRRGGRHGRGLTTKHTVVKGFNASKAAPQPDRFVNTRAQAFWRLRRLLEEGELDLPQDPKLRADLMALRVEYTAAGKVQIGGKEAVKARLGRSPDFADAVAISLYPDLKSSEGYNAKWR